MRSPLFLIALLVAGISLCPCPVRGDELPEDTNKIESLTPEQARKFAKDFPGLEVGFEPDEERYYWWSSGLPLQGLTTLNPKTAEELARFKGNAILLTGLNSLDVDTATSFAAYGGDVVVTENVQKTFLATHPLSPENTLAWAVVARGDLSCVPALDLAIAKVLAGFEGFGLYLNGLTTLDADTAKALGGFEGALHLDGLTTIGADTAKALSGFKGRRLTLGGLTTLSPEAAKALAAAQKWDGELLRLTALDSHDSMEIAQALATRKGTLELTNLKKISPKTLTALIEKRDVEIPLIETLELIQEPDGSPTEDFIIPDWLEERQKQHQAEQAAE